jgi:hypothetical protein
MDVAQITDALTRVFEHDNARVVFWNDPDGEFVKTIPSIALEGVSVLQLDQIGALEAKMRIEQDDPTGRYLLYSPTEEPDYEDDWLLDMRLYGRSFRADRASIILQELGLAHQSLRQHLAKRRKFFDNKERLLLARRATDLSWWHRLTRRARQQGRPPSAPAPPAP